MLRKKTFSRRKKITVKRLAFFLGILFSFIFISFLAIKRFHSYFFQTKPYVSPLPSVLSQNKNKFQKEDKEQELKQLLAQNHIQFSRIISEDSIIRIILPKSEEIIFSKSKSLVDQTSSLQLILSRLTIEGKRFAKIDFRFDRPIISM